MFRTGLIALLIAGGVALATVPAGAQSCSIGGHVETSENFTSSGGGWAALNMSPGSVPSPAPVANHLLISEVAPRGAGTGSASDSSEYIEIYNPTQLPVRLDNKYLSDDSQYFRIVNGPYPIGVNSDFTLRFPQGLSLNPGRTLIVCVTKAGFFGSGASPGAAQYFLEMKDSNANAADDMIQAATGSVFPVTGGMLTNPGTTNGEWVVLFCWNGASDLVCDIDYASWGVNSASNPKMDKTGISIDGPDAGAVASAYNADVAAGSQTNLGTVLNKPMTYQRVANGHEGGETPLGGNGCIGKVTVSTLSWAPIATGSIRFHLQFQNPDDDAMSTPFTGTIRSQEFGVFLPDYGDIGTYQVPPLQPSSFFDVFIEVPLAQLPPPPQKRIPGQGGIALPAFSLPGHRTDVACPPDTNWAGNVDVQWSGNSQTGQVNKHYSDLLTCPGGAPSMIHVRPSNCPNPMGWTVPAPLCPGFSATLLNEDFSPAPNPLPVGWSGWIQVSAAAAVPSGTNCCFGIIFTCGNGTSTIDICSTACDCQPAGPPPTSTNVTWTVNGTSVTFVSTWCNNGTTTTGATTVTLNSQQFGVFLPDFGPICTFTVPPLQPGQCVDISCKADLSQLPPNPQVTYTGNPPPAGTPCAPTDHWHGNVDLIYQSAGGTGQANYHFGEMPVNSGQGPTYLFVESGCDDGTGTGTGASWTINGLCPGFTATLVNPDHSPAPNPLPTNWVGQIAVSAAAGVPNGTTCCFTIDFVCAGKPGQIKVCAKACSWQSHPPQPVLSSIDWVKITDHVKFHLHWTNPDPASPTDPVSGTMNSQPFGAFAPDFGPIGQFNVPPLAPSSFFDVFIEVPLTQLPQQPREVLPGGGPAPGSPCPPDTSWSGNVDVQWGNTAGTSQTNYHFTNLLVKPGVGTSHIHTLVFCNSAAGAAWSITGLCPGFTATLLNENFTPAPNPVPAGWTGWISVGAAASVPPGTNCCFQVHFVCDNVPGTINVCAQTCAWQNTGVDDGPATAEFGIRSTVPNPTSAGMTVSFGMPTAGAARVEVFTLTGQRVATLFDGMAKAGVNDVRWNGATAAGRRLPPGAYFVKLASQGQATSRKIVLVQ